MKNKTITPQKAKIITKLLYRCSETLDKLAIEYKNIGWDLTADYIESAANEYRNDAKGFKEHYEWYYNTD